jgi:hypothetical protein
MVNDEKKVLWVVNYDDLSWFVERAQFVNATGVAIRTDNNLEAALERFHDVGIRVYGWRWPSSHHDPAMKEAEKVIRLIDKGLDGYYVDPEGAPGKPYDWNKDGLAELAEEFCSAITAAKPNFEFGTTSHYRAKKIFKKIPWESFFRHTTVFLPQAYWRVDGGVVGHGIPGDNYRVSLDFWEAAGATRDQIVPMAGELHHSTPGEIALYTQEAKNQNVSCLHFYTAREIVKPSVWNAIASANIDEP